MHETRASAMKQMSSRTAQCKPYGAHPCPVAMRDIMEPPWPTERAVAKRTAVLVVESPRKPRDTVTPRGEGMTSSRACYEPTLPRQLLGISARRTCLAQLQRRTAPASCACLPAPVGGGWCKSWGLPAGAAWQRTRRVHTAPSSTNARLARLPGHRLSGHDLALVLCQPPGKICPRSHR